MMWKRAGTDINFDDRWASVTAGERRTTILRGIITQTILTLTRPSGKRTCSTGRIRELEFIRPQFLTGAGDHTFTIHNSSAILTLQFAACIQWLKSGAGLNADILIRNFFHTECVWRNSVSYRRRGARSSCLTGWGKCLSRCSCRRNSIHRAASGADWVGTSTGGAACVAGAAEPPHAEANTTTKIVVASNK